ncbi:MULTISPECIES: glyoxalase III HchA [unclassified Cupriavidus]|uniref:glyoxalase III HchA n=1 Tax=unclassified Cupriavidus TaxID=2640874 RepID=UPI0002911DF0|nr:MULTISPECIES: glyoxalase III HchA [unclassified Cupriavidus]ESJ12460.1 heat shock protein HSP31 [Cupriavidus sp. HPC(L)]MCD9123446.1 protein deglycase HchA [Cupriavidus sp. UGS-1]
MSDQTARKPQPDPAERNAFFPSSFSLSQFTSPKSDLSGADYPTPYTGGQKILMIGADERYLLTDNGTFFSTGNHPVETLLPMYHLDKAGFAFDVATVSGNPVKFEFWAMPSEDEAVNGFFDKYRPQFQKPLKLADVVAGGLDTYAAIFIPGGHGALIGIPESKDVGDALKWAAANDKFVISLCHGPAGFLAVGDSDIYRGYKICAFPDAMDAQTPDIGYMPGHLTWKFGEKLKALGFEIINDNISGAVHRDRKLLTGDSPLAGNNLGKLAAQTLLNEVTA